jgi:hypothetical protein
MASAGIGAIVGVGFVPAQGVRAAVDAAAEWTHTPGSGGHDRFLSVVDQIPCPGVQGPPGRGSDLLWSYGSAGICGDLAGQAVDMSGICRELIVLTRTTVALDGGMRG